jgi:hypothetical protein
VVYTIPKVLRLLFRSHRKLLPLLPRAAWRAWETALRHQGGRYDARAATVASIQTAGNLLSWNPHLHTLAPLGLFDSKRRFHPLAAGPDPADLEQRFRRSLLRLLVRHQCLHEETARRLLAWEHSGFHVHVGSAIAPSDHAVIERLAAYILRPPLALHRMSIGPAGQVAYQADRHNPNFGSDTRIFNPLDFIAEATQHIPEPYVNLNLFYGRYSTRTRGEQRKIEALPSSGAIQPPGVPSQADRATVAPVGGAATDEDRDSSPTSRARRKRWAACIRRIHTADPLRCPNCADPEVPMKILAFLTQPATIDRILRAVGFQEPLLPTALPSPGLRLLLEESAGLTHPYDRPSTRPFLPGTGATMAWIDAGDGDPPLTDEDFLDAPAPDLESPDFAPSDFDDSS